MAKAKQAKEKVAEKAAPKRAPEPHEPVKPPRLFEFYKKDIVPNLVKRFHYKNVSEAPKLERISVNMGLGAATQDPKILEGAAKELEMIVGQKPVITRAKKSISNFKLRQGVPIGCRVTLRRARMYEFLDRFINTGVPRIRDFRGFSEKSFDGRGNYTVGIKEQIIFPEIDVDKVSRIVGMDITFVTTAKTDEEGYELLKGFGMPFVRRQDIIETKTEKSTVEVKGA
jgi:large subunit ribosomal protein L5